MSNLCSEKSVAVKSMLSGGIGALLEILYENQKSTETDDTIHRRYEIVACLSKHVTSFTVRNLVSQILIPQQEQLLGIVSLCCTQHLELAYFASRFTAFLLLNPDNVPVLRRCKAFKQLKMFTARDHLTRGSANGIVMYVSYFKNGLVALLESPYPEVVNLLLWMLARYTCGDLRIGPSTNSKAIPNYVVQELLPQIRMYAHSLDKRSRELAEIILKNVGDSEFYPLFENIETWVKSLDLGTELSDTVKKLNKNNMKLHLLLNPDITLDQILIILRGLNIEGASCLSILGALAKVRNENEIVKKQALEIAYAMKIQEREIAAVNNKNKGKDPENSTKSSVSKKSIFISYCWSNKENVHKVYNTLTEKGFGCWLDESMRGGSQLFAEIENGISDCQIFISCCSNQYGASVNCKREVNLASDRNKLIIPVLVGTCDP